MFKIQINATHWKTTRDSEDEVSISFKVPMSDMSSAVLIPNNINLILTVEDGYLTKGETNA